MSLVTLLCVVTFNVMSTSVPAWALAGVALAVTCTLAADLSASSFESESFEPPSPEPHPVRERTRTASAPNWRFRLIIIASSHRHVVGKAIRLSLGHLSKGDPMRLRRIARATVFPLVETIQ